MAGPASGPATILDEIRAEIIGRGSTCTAGAFIATLPEPDRDAIRAAVDTRTPASAIGRWLKKSRGYFGTTDTVVRHVTGRCKCQTIR